MIIEGSDAIALAILQHLKSKHQTSSAITVIDMKHDVFRYLFRGKGRTSSKAGCTLLEREDFHRCKFFNTNDWDTYIDNLGDGAKVMFPIRVKPYLSWGPKTYSLAEGKIIPKPRYHLEKVSITFTKTACTLM